MLNSSESKRRKIEEIQNISCKKQKIKESNVIKIVESEKQSINQIKYNIPECGTPVNRREFRKAGPYIIGTEVVGYRPIKSIVQYLARKENTNEFYQLKILQISVDDNDNSDEIQGKLLLHTEYSLLSLLQHESGVVKHHGFFSDIAMEETGSKLGKSSYTGIAKKRLILVLDCLIRHPYCDKSASYISLQEYLSSVKILSESEAVNILYEIVKIVESIHKKNVVHRDLKLGNIVLNRNSKKVIITNFCLGKYLINEDVLLYDQWGSPAYISPDVVCGKPYKGKPSDMWALGVVFFMMLFGDFPFFKPTSTALFAQIQSGEYHMPSTDVSQYSAHLVNGLLNVDPKIRFTASELRRRLESLLAVIYTKTPDQLVPSTAKRNQYSASSNALSINLPAKDDQVVPNVRITNETKDKSGKKELSSLNIDGLIPITNSSEHKGICSSNSVKRIRAIPIKTLWGANRLPSQINLSMRSSIENYVDGSSVNLGNHSQNIENNRPNRLQRLPRVTFPSRTRQNLFAPLVGSGVIYDNVTRNFVSLLNAYFASGRIRPPRTGALREFNGILSYEIATTLTRWLLDEFGNNPLIRQIFGNTEENAINKVKQLLMRCGVHMEISIFGPKISRNQCIHVLLILTYMLKVIGYNNTYFITQLAPSSS